MEWKGVRRGEVPNDFLEQLPDNMREGKDYRNQSVDVTDDQLLQVSFLKQLQASKQANKNRANSAPTVNDITIKCFAQRLQEVETRLGTLSASANDVRAAFETLYSTTSSILHEAGLRFEGEIVVIPRPLHPLTIAHCLALATVVKRIGFDVELDGHSGV
jgi:hypothetical protein